MEIKISTYKKQSTLISSIIFFIIGGILFTDPDIIITTVSKIFGVIFFILGLFFIFLIFIKRDPENNATLSKIISAVFMIGLAILFFFFSETVEKTLRIVVGFWIIFCGINRLITALRITSRNKKYFSLIIIALLLILIGVYTIVIGEIITKTLGIILMFYLTALKNWSLIIVY